MGSQPAIEFDSGLKVLWTEVAMFGTGGHRQRTAYADGVAEFEWRVADVLFGDEVFSNRPTPNVAAENELRLQFSFLFLPRLGVASGQILLPIVPHHFTQAPVCPVDVGELDVEHRVDPVFPREQPEPVFPAVTGE